MKDYAELFNIEKDYIALNHGSFGACTKEVLEHHFTLQRRMESLTTRFFTLELRPLLIESLKTLAEFVHASPGNLVFVRNATTAAHSVLNSFIWEKGDEIVATNLLYEACRYQLEYLVQAKGVILRLAQLPFPLETEEQVVSEIMSKVSRRTKLVCVDHVTSETAAVLPVARICRELKATNIPVFVDGAHAPGMLPLNLEEMAPDFYTGNCHKWLCAPKGSAFLYVNPERHKDMIPSVISFFFRKGITPQEQFFYSFFWSGTAIDYLSCSMVKFAVEFLEKSVTGGWQGIMTHNRKLVRIGREIIRDILKLDQYTPDNMTGSMVTFKLNSKSEKDPVTLVDKLCLQLLYDYKIEAFISRLYQTEERILRISAHLYNKESDYLRLAESLKKLLKR
jgi:isopenicillin-N epimerase